MANRVLTLAVGMGVAVNLLAGSAWAGTASVGATGAAPVREQNLDANGSIRVHEQGTVMSQVTNFPLNPDGSLKTSGSASVTGTVAATQSGPWSVGLDLAASSYLSNIDTATSGLRYDTDGNLKVSVAPTGSAADPSVADQTPFGINPAAGIPAGTHVTINAGGGPARVTSYFVQAIEGKVQAFFMDSDSPTFGVRLATGESATAALAHPILADAWRFECLPGDDCIVFYSAAGY